MCFGQNAQLLCARQWSGLSLTRRLACPQSDVHLAWSPWALGLHSLVGSSWNCEHSGFVCRLQSLSGLSGSAFRPDIQDAAETAKCKACGSRDAVQVPRCVVPSPQQQPPKARAKTSPKAKKTIKGPDGTVYREGGIGRKNIKPGHWQKRPNIPTTERPVWASATDCGQLPVCPVFRENPKTKHKGKEQARFTGEAESAKRHFT